MSQPAFDAIKTNDVVRIMLVNKCTSAHKKANTNVSTQMQIYNFLGSHAIVLCCIQLELQIFNDAFVNAFELI